MSDKLGPRLAKAVRLLAEGRVAPASAPVQEFVVDGDNGRYRVFVGAHTRVCTCEANGWPCSHIEAALAWTTASEAEQSLMRAALDERKARDVVAAKLLERLGA